MREEKRSDFFAFCQSQAALCSSSSLFPVPSLLSALLSPSPSPRPISPASQVLEEISASTKQQSHLDGLSMKRRTKTAETRGKSDFFHCCGKKKALFCSILKTRAFLASRIEPKGSFAPVSAPTRVFRESLEACKVKNFGPIRELEIVEVEPGFVHARLENENIGRPADDGRGGENLQTPKNTTLQNSKTSCSIPLLRSFHFLSFLRITMKINSQELYET